jgi:hypothetical protein
MRKQTLALSLLLSALALTACQSTENGSQSESSNQNGSAENAAPAPANEQRVQRVLTPVERIPAPPIDAAQDIPDLTGELESEGLGLTMIVDGSSPQAFADSLQMIAADTSAEQYQGLEASLQLLEVYTLDASDLESFYRSLDGMTGEEIIELAQRRNRR